MTGNSDKERDTPRFGRVPAGSWLIGFAMVVILGGVASPFVMSLAGYGLPYREAGPRGTPFTLSDALTIAGTILGFWCLGWVVSKQICRRVDRVGRPPDGWIRFLITVAMYVAVLVLSYVIPMKESYASAVSVGCAIMVMTTVGKALRGEQNAPELDRKK